LAVYVYCIQVAQKQVKKITQPKKNVQTQTVRKIDVQNESRWYFRVMYCFPVRPVENNEASEPKPPLVVRHFITASHSAVVQTVTDGTARHVTSNYITFHCVTNKMNHCMK
jgi:hypothetical protein